MSEAIRPEWWFYHLSRTALEVAAPPLLQKCLEAGWRVLAVSPDKERLAKLDAALWTFDDNSFLPHGQAEAPGLDPARQLLIQPGLEGPKAGILKPPAQRLHTHPVCQRDVALQCLPRQDVVCITACISLSIRPFLELCQPKTENR